MVLNLFLNQAFISNIPLKIPPALNGSATSHRLLTLRPIPIQLSASRLMLLAFDVFPLWAKEDSNFQHTHL